MKLAEPQTAPKISSTQAPVGHLHLVETPREGTRQPVVGRFRAAFERTAAARQALAKKDLAPVNLEVQATVNIVLSVLPGLHALRDALVASVPASVLARFDVTSAPTPKRSRSRTWRTAQRAGPRACSSRSRRAASSSAIGCVPTFRRSFYVGSSTRGSSTR